MEAETSINEFFQAHVERACQREAVPADPATAHYLVCLLTGYAAQHIDTTPLALRLRDALEATPSARRVQLREIGDTSLYVSGFWAESFERRLVDIDYYIGVGETAYSQLAQTPADRQLNLDVFAQLARNFPRFVRVLTAIRETLLPTANASDVIRLYERWATTRSHWARQRLAGLGVLVPANATGRLQ